MVKSNPHNGSQRRRTQSAANPRMYRGVAPDPEPDHRIKTNAQGQQGNGTCCVCSAEMALRKVSYNNPSRFGDLPNGTPVLPNHRVGGGRYSLIRNDVLCAGSGRIAVTQTEE